MNKEICPNCGEVAPEFDDPYQQMDWYESHGLDLSGNPIPETDPYEGLSEPF